jgi:hypothetical protein
MSHFLKAKLRDGREYERNPHGSYTGYVIPRMRCYRCGENKTGAGGRRHPVLGLLCKSCVENGK